MSHKTRLKERRKHLKQGIKEGLVALIAKKAKAIIKSSSSLEDEKDDAEVSLLNKGFTTFFES